MTGNISNTNVSILANIDGANILISVLNILLVFVIIVGNSLTITAIAKFKRLMYPSNIMIASLSLADLFLGVAYTPIKLLRAHAPLLLKRRPICLTFMFISHLSSLNAIVFLAMLSIERFYAVQFPFHYHAHMTIKSGIVCNVIICVVNTIVIVPLVTGIDLWFEGVDCYAPTLYPSIYTRSIIGIGFGTMLVGFICFLRVAEIELNFRRRVMNFARRHVATPTNVTRDTDMNTTRDTSVNIHNGQANNEHETKELNSIKTKLVLTAYTVSLCLWTPHMAVYLWDSVTKQHQNPYVFRVLSLLDLSSSAINCFLYGWKNSRFRDAYRQLMGFKKSPIEPSVTFTTRD